MANTEIRHVIRLVHDAVDAVDRERDTPGLTDAQRRLLKRTYDRLHHLERDLIYADLASCVDALEGSSRKLAAVAKRIQRTIDQLKGVAETVETVAKAVGLLVKIAEASAALRAL